MCPRKRKICREEFKKSCVEILSPSPWLFFMFLRFSWQLSSRPCQDAYSFASNKTFCGTIWFDQLYAYALHKYSGRTKDVVVTAVCSCPSQLCILHHYQNGCPFPRYIDTTAALLLEVLTLSFDLLSVFVCRFGSAPLQICSGLSAAVSVFRRANNEADDLQDVFPAASASLLSGNRWNIVANDVWAGS